MRHKDPGKYGSKTGREAKERAQMVGLVDKNFKILIINMFRDLKEAILRELKEEYDENASPKHL